MKFCLNTLRLKEKVTKSLIHDKILFKYTLLKEKNAKFLIYNI